MEKKGNKSKKSNRYGILFIANVVNVSLPQRKISENENSFPSFPQHHNRGKDSSFI